MDTVQDIQYKIVFEKLEEARLSGNLGAELDELQVHSQEIMELVEALARQAAEPGRLYTST
jgi:hypothetical protein